MTSPIKIKAADKYFAYIGKHFPVMCASGAFPLLPPVTSAAKWLDRLDDLSSRNIEKHVNRLAKFKTDFDMAQDKAKSNEEKGVANALSLSVSSAIAELDSIRSWEKNPELYLQVAFTGLAQAADKPSKTEKEREKRFVKRLRAIPSFLAQAQNNIDAISTTSRGVSQTMIRDCARYLTELGKSSLGAVGKAPRYLQDTLTALRDYDRFVATRPEQPENEGPAFSDMMRNVAGTTATPEMIYCIAEQEYDRRKTALQEQEAHYGMSWKEAFQALSEQVNENEEAVDVVIREMHRLRAFIFDNALPEVFHDSTLRIDPQPQHLASTLRPIHYDPALGAWSNEPSYCHVSPQMFTGRGYRDDPVHLARMRREYLFMAARQTYPGRHLLDSQRRALNDTPMSQITNPLFMAGWLSFAENILEEFGYLQTAQDKLVHHQRALSRAALAMIDAGLAAHKLDQDACMEILNGAGYSREEALKRVRAIRLAPASRVMPVLGLHEIERLRENSNLPLDQFCTRLFANGQIPLKQLESLV